ncbi:MAG: glucosamine-6-phosphate deaminase [Acidobacteriaceae bacterium]
METGNTEPRRLRIGNLKLEIYPDGRTAGIAAGRSAGKLLLALAGRLDDIGIIFATGISQLEILKELTSIHGLPWDRVSGFHLDEYIGLPADHPASFRHYLRQNLTQRVKMRHFFEIDGTAADPQRECADYAGNLRAHSPQLCFLGIGENGHLAFNDPGEADFEDPKDVKIVELEEVSRRQQLEERWFKTLAEVPKRAITLTLPTILRVPQLLVTAPGRRKAEIVRRTIEETISTDCPATILRTHPNVTLYLDEDSASELKDA